MTSLSAQNWLTLTLNQTIPQTRVKFPGYETKKGPIHTFAKQQYLSQYKFKKSRQQFCGIILKLIIIMFY